MKVLILNQLIVNFTGSEINAVQIAKALGAKGHRVDIGTFIFRNPLKKIADQQNLHVFNLISHSFDSDYDLIWAHHAPTLTYFLYHHAVSSPKLIFSSLSTIINLEAPPLYIDEIPLFLSHNPVNSRILISNGVPEDKIYYFPNFASAQFFSHPRSDFAFTPKKIAVVSNHPPQELRKFAALAKKRNAVVEFIGIEDKPVYVDEQLLGEFDLVITIGKTVFYYFAMKIPVYCYDHFGGPGYIKPKNFEMSREHNFSGLGFNRFLDAKELAADIFSGYAEATQRLDYLNEKCFMYFNLEKNLDALLERIEGLPSLDVAHFRRNNSLAKRTYGAYMNVFWELESLKNKHLSIEKRVFNYLIRKVWKYLKRF